MRTSLMYPTKPCVAFLAGNDSVAPYCTTEEVCARTVVTFSVDATTLLSRSSEHVSASHCTSTFV